MVSIIKKHLTTNAIIIQSDDGVYAQQVNYGTSLSTPSNRSVTDVIVRHFEDYSAKFIIDKINTGFICSLAGGQDIDVSQGTANVKGIEVNSDGIFTITIPTVDDTYYIILQKGDDGFGAEARIPLNDTISLTYVIDGDFDEDTDYIIAKVDVVGSTLVAGSFEDFGAFYEMRQDHIKPRNGSTVKLFTGSYPVSNTFNTFFSGVSIYNPQDGAQHTGGYFTGYDNDLHVYHLSGTGNIIDNKNSQDMWVRLDNISKFGFRSTGFEVVDNLIVSGTTLLEGDLTIGGNSIIGTNVNLTNTKLENLDDIGGLSHSNGNFIVSDGTDWVVENGQTVLTSLGFGTISNAPAINQDLLTETSNVEFNSIWSGTMWSGASIANAYIDDDITLTNITQITNRAHTNLTAIGLNSHSQIDTHLAGNTASGVTNASNIAGNTASGVTNASNIAGNTASGVTNASNIGTNVSNIAGNTASGVTNAGNIAGNTASGVTNTSNIATNVTAIGLNTTHRTDVDGGVHGFGAISNTPAIDQSLLEASAVAFSTIDIGSTIIITGILDEDAMGSNSAVKLVTQQSVKAYTDNSVKTHTIIDPSPSRSTSWSGSSSTSPRVNDYVTVDTNEYGRKSSNFVVDVVNTDIGDSATFLLAHSSNGGSNWTTCETGSISSLGAETRTCSHTFTTSNGGNIQFRVTRTGGSTMSVSNNTEATIKIGYPLAIW